MQCGHCFCIECIRIVVDRYSFGGRRRTVKCAVCRQTSLHGEISYVTTSQGQCVDNDLALRVKVIYKLVKICHFVKGKTLYYSVLLLLSKMYMNLLKCLDRPITVGSLNGI